MTRPVPTWVYHFTHVDHLPTIVHHGLVSDAAAQRDGRIVHEVGDRGVKGRRRHRPVPIEGRTVAAFSAEPADWDDLVDWPLMLAERWDSTPEDPERMERRMAECLVHAAVPWSMVGRGS